MKLQDIDNSWIKQFNDPFIIAGPCSAESEAQIMNIAEQLQGSSVQVYRAGVWKPRTRPNCFEGVGEPALKWLRRVKDETNLLIATEVANAYQAKLALDYGVDILWIGARSTVNPFTIQEIAEALEGTDKPVIVKNPVNPDLELWIGALERFMAMGVNNLAVIHRGFSSYKKTKFRNIPNWQLVLDFKNRFPNIPVICDPSHICGNRENLFEVAQQAMNFNFHGLMLETHHSPDEAWSDAKQQIEPIQLLKLLSNLQLRNPQVSDVFFQSQLQQLRNEIDEIDVKVMEVLAQRMEVAHEIGEIKAENNVAIFQPERWDKIVNKVLQLGKSMNFSEEFAEELFKLIHQESIRVQTEAMNKKKETK